MANGIYKAIKMLVTNYDIAVKDQTIHKPIAWSLYQVWKYFDEKEKSRK